MDLLIAAAEVVPDKKEVSPDFICVGDIICHLNAILISSVNMNYFKSDRFDLQLKNTAAFWILIIQDKRIQAKADFDAKKAAKEANKLKMKQKHAQAKEGKLPLQL